MRNAVVVRGAVVMRSAGPPILSGLQIPSHQRAANAVTHDLSVAHRVASAARVHRGVRRSMVPTSHAGVGNAVAMRSRVMMTTRVANRSRVAMRSRVMMCHGPVIVIESCGGWRNERRGQFGPRLYRRRRWWRWRHVLIRHCLRRKWLRG